MERIQIKKIGVEDASFLREVAVKAYADHYLHLWYDEGKWYIEKYFSEQRLRSELEDKNTAFYIAYLDKLAVGFLKLNIDAPLFGVDSPNGLELERIYLTKNATGKGVGKALVNLTVDVARTYQKEFIWLKAMDSSNDAIGFYKTMGFQVSGTFLLKHELMKEELRVMVVMTKPV